MGLRRPPVGANRSAIVSVMAAVALLFGCVSDGPRDRPPAALAQVDDEARALARHLLETESDPPAPPPGGVRVRLAFGAGADLDLYVTDPTFETVYFANSPNRAGGRLAEDVRCDGASPRVETIVFPATLAGTYRVGVDFPARCEGGSSPTPYAVQIDGARITASQQGMIEVGRFLPIVLDAIAEPAEP